MEQENMFLFRLAELAGDTRAVEIDALLDIYLYAKHHGITEVAFITGAYFGQLFEDELFLFNAGIYDCSIDAFVRHLEEAKKTKSVFILRAFQEAHKRALTFLSEETTKDKIRALIADRKAALEQHVVDHLRMQVLQVVQQFPQNAHAKLYAEILPRLL